ncbi:hypothetical protein RRG08_028687 [Elysia crispata]|uniref:Heme NO-binding domain-containing protein n=1 Tax=Elysia crispata TaxID=231223 RepID=A0AAE1B0T6_9GAST|nr:hypothetical protein RRG08_028687 [Elysia crispata]
MLRYLTNKRARHVQVFRPTNYHVMLRFPTNKLKHIKTPSGSTRWKPRGRMYGLLFESVQMYIKQDYGDELWVAVLEQSGLPQVVIQLHKTYPDEWMLNLAKSAAQVLGNQVNDVMLYFGTCFVSFFTKFNYDQILR